VSHALYHGIFMLKSNVDTSIELDTIMCTKNKKVWTLGWVNMGNDLTREHVFLPSSDDKLVLFLFPGIPTGDLAIVAFYDKRIYKKLRMKELSLSDPLYYGKKQHRNMTK
jgi:hypothetical protein